MTIPSNHRLGHPFAAAGPIPPQPAAPAPTPTGSGRGGAAGKTP